MTSKNCLNCGKQLTDQFCSGCGQKADTHRISFNNFISHDLLHGTFHIERGLLFTAKEALFRPGKAALDYISGKRKRYYNVFYFILITFAFIIFLRHYDLVLTEYVDGKLPTERKYINEASKTVDQIFSQKSKLFILLFIPLAALNSYIFFRRKKLNLSEHFIVAGMILLGMLLISAFGNLFFYLDFMIPFNTTFAVIMSWLVSLLIAFHIGFGYYNAFGSDYTKWGITYRIVLFYALFCLEVVILLVILVGFVTDWKFGQITLSPFG
ncbi:DUF3667 domain-containing protein [Flavobacterium sp.]